MPLLRVLILTTIVAGISLASAPAVAAPVSLNNPYRSYNVTGVNYGSVRWERSHHGSRATASRAGGWGFFRRR